MLPLYVVIDSNSNVVETTLIKPDTKYVEFVIKDVCDYVYVLVDYDKSIVGVERIEMWAQHMHRELCPGGHIEKHTLIQE